MIHNPMTHVPIDRLTIAPAPSGVSRERTDLTTEREIRAVEADMLVTAVVDVPFRGVCDAVKCNSEERAGLYEKARAEMKATSKAVTVV